jgi:hypothetical protein
MIGEKIVRRINVTERLGRRCQRLLDDVKELRHWKWKEEALDRTLWKTRFATEYGLVDE